ncbi:cytochrome b/b6 domain-containing protein [Xanthobacter sp. AM11]|uniref:cytochrome b/b6 domain-containing protein n=1 Tax=Xanthobacter sp. AM11 TaxID=3380643 RepID=UPI0039BEE266
MDKRTPPEALNALPPQAGAGRWWVKVWDAPTRLFHWSIVALVATSYATARLGRIDWHFYSGYAILALVLFRIAWGLAGSQTARFASFLRSPAAAVAHLRHALARQVPDEAGHNAAGGLMVAALLALLLLQAVSGLFSNDGLFVEGPLAHLAGPDLSERITILHGVVFNLILAAVAVHVAAVLLYALVLRQDLVRPMFTGWKRLPAGTSSPRLAPIWLAGLFAALAAAAVWALATFA